MDKTINDKLRVEAKRAIEVQDACNLSGVVHSLSRVLTDVIWPAVRESGGGTENVNEHPIVVLYVSKLVALSGGGNLEAFSKAYKVCKRMAAEVEEVK